MRNPTIDLRPIGPGDLAFLSEVYASTRREELAPLGWSAEQQAAFLGQQFAAQHHHYTAHYQGASFQVILVGGKPAGRLYVARWPGEIRIVDIALLPEFRRAGVGSRLLAGLLAEADRAGAIASIHVEKLNPALRLYERLGFARAADREVYWLMERPPQAM